MKNDTVGKTFLVATLLCVFCSILVSSSAVLLKPLQTENKKLDIQKNLLLSAGILKNSKASKKEVSEAFKNIKSVVVDLETGKVLKNINPEKYDQRSAAKDSKQNIKIPDELNIAGIGFREKLSKVYFVMKDTNIDQVILPFYGKGLWSTMYGFLSLAVDTITIKGIGFYEHGETPGLGGEIDNPRWKKIFIGKKIFDLNFKPILKVLKGKVGVHTKNRDSKIDGLSGATLTSVGVENTFTYWLGDHGFGPFLNEFRKGSIK